MTSSGCAWFLVADRERGTSNSTGRTWHAWIHPEPITRDQEKRTPADQALCGFVNGAALTAFNVTFEPDTVCSDQLCQRCYPIASYRPATPPSPVDAVNHPSHYGGDTVYEVIKVIDAWGLDFPIGNAVKYLARAGKKDPAKTVEDLEKAIFYINHKIKRIKAGEPK